MEMSILICLQELQNALGHAHPKLVNALQGQVEKFIHVSNIYYNEPAIEYAKYFNRILTDLSYKQWGRS